MKSQIYNFLKPKNKWKGLIEYKSLVVVIIILFVIFSFGSIFNINYKITIGIAITISPILVVILVCHTKTESSLDVIKVLLVFFLNKKIYVNGYNNISKEAKKFNKIYIKKL